MPPFEEMYTTCVMMLYLMACGVMGIHFSQVIVFSHSLLLLLSLFVAAILYENYYHHSPDKATPAPTHSHTPPVTMKNRPLPSEPTEQAAAPLYPPIVGMANIIHSYSIRTHNNSLVVTS